MFEDETTEDGRHRLVIVGGGVAGLDLAASLARHPRYTVTLIDLATAHVWKPMLHSIAAGTRDAALVEAPYVAQARRHGFTYVAGRARAIDRAAKVIDLAAFSLYGRDLLPERQVPYDTLVLAVGSVAADFGVPGVVEHSRQIDTLVQAKAFQAELLPRLVEATRTGHCLRVAIVGGGATGVQLAAEMLQMADIADDYGLDDARATLDVTLVDRGPRLLLAFPDTISAAARRRLEKLGVTVRTDVEVTAVTADGLSLQNEALPADIVVWAAGVQAAPLTNTLTDLERERDGRILVDATCRAVGDPAIYAIGDCAARIDAKTGRPLPPTAQVAYQQAVYLARALPRALAGRTVKPFRHRDLGALVHLGDYDAFGTLGDYGIFPSVFRGRIAHLGHAILYRRHQMRIHGVLATLRLMIADLMSAPVKQPYKLS